MDVSWAPVGQALSPQSRGPLGHTAGCPDGTRPDPGDHPGGLGGHAAHLDPAGPAGEHLSVGHRLRPAHGEAAGHRPGLGVRDERSGSGYTDQFPGVAAEVTEMSGAGTVDGFTNELPSGPALTAWCSALPFR
jgi:hypothetical protein